MGRRCPGWETWTSRAALRCSSCVVLWASFDGAGRPMRAAMGCLSPRWSLFWGMWRILWVSVSLSSSFFCILICSFQCMLRSTLCLPSLLPLSRLLFCGTLLTLVPFLSFVLVYDSTLFFICSTKLFIAEVLSSVCSMLRTHPHLFTLIRLKSWISSGVRSLHKALLGIFLLVILV